MNVDSKRSGNGASRSVAPSMAHHFPKGQVLPGTKWVVRGILGEGGMGVVLDVVKEPGLHAAIKVLKPEYAKDKEFVERFSSEIKVLASLQHPHIVRVHDHDWLPDGSPYIVMERLWGSNLRLVAKLRAKRSERRISARYIYKIAHEICEGLQCAHTNDPPVVHRDLKPDNIFVHKAPFGEETVKLIDFGIAELVGAAAVRLRGTSVVGTPRYMAPESLRGEATSARSDIYSLAVVVYELLTLRFPWDVELRTVRELLEAKMDRLPIAASTFTKWVPASVDKCLTRALSKHPWQRQSSVGEFMWELQDLQSANDGTLVSDDINTTIPTLATLTQLAKEEREAEDDRAETERTPDRENIALEDGSAEHAGPRADPKTKEERGEPAISLASPWSSDAPSSKPREDEVLELPKSQHPREDEDAKTLLHAGLEHFAEQQFDAARESFAQAYALDPEAMTRLQELLPARSSSMVPESAPLAGAPIAERAAAPVSSLQTPTKKTRASKKLQRWWVAGTAVGLVLAVAAGASLRSSRRSGAARAPASSAMGTGFALPPGWVSAMSSVASGAADGGSGEVTSAAVREDAGNAAETIVARAGGVDLEAGLGDLGVAPLPTQEAVASLLGERVAPRPPSSAAGQKVLPKPRSAAARDEVYDLFSATIESSLAQKAAAKPTPEPPRTDAAAQTIPAKPVSAAGTHASQRDGGAEWKAWREP